MLSCITVFRILNFFSSIRLAREVIKGLLCLLALLSSFLFCIFHLRVGTRWIPLTCMVHLGEWEKICFVCDILGSYVCFESAKLQFGLHI